MKAPTKTSFRKIKIKDYSSKKDIFERNRLKEKNLRMDKVVRKYTEKFERLNRTLELVNISSCNSSFLENSFSKIQSNIIKEKIPRKHQ